MEVEIERQQIAEQGRPLVESNVAQELVDSRARPLFPSRFKTVADVIESRSAIKEEKPIVAAVVVPYPSNPIDAQSRLAIIVIVFR